MRMLTILATAALLAGCSPVATVNETLEPPLRWEFIESVGGIGVMLPIERDDAWVLPVTLDLSRASGTGVPTGLVCSQIKASVQGGLIRGRVYDIELRVYANDLNNLAQVEGDDSCRYVPLALGFPYSLIPVSKVRQYRIWYREELGERHLITTMTPLEN